MRISSVILLFAVVILFANCEDDIPAVEYKQQGFIRGTIEGTASDDDTDIDETFRYTRYAPGLTLSTQAFSYYELDDDGSIEAAIFRQDLSTGSYVYFEFELEDADDTTPDDMYFEIVYIKEANEILYFEMDNDDDNDFEISDFSFDITTGRLKAGFSLEGEENSTDNNATVEGDMDVVIKQVLY